MNESQIFTNALKLGAAAERAAYLDGACGGDAQLRAAVEDLLRARAGDPQFLENPAARAAADAPTPTAGAAAERPGAVLAGRYKLLEEVGEGGMGTVWMAQQQEPVRRTVAVKVIKAGMDTALVAARFEAERQALALMDHPNIAKVHDAGTTPDGRPFFAMELVKGVPITRYCDEYKLTPRQRLELFVPVCHAVQHAHQKGVIHRDLKPSNVLVARYDDRPVPKVIDFGVAKATGQQLTKQTLHTGFGTVVGTVEYMSPEQATFNQLDVDTRSDIYSLGVLLYELLAGSPPFTRQELEKAGMLEMLRVIREQEPSKPSAKLSTADALPTLAANRGTEPARLARLMRGELDWIVMKALEKDRNRRYETANALAMDAQRYLADEPVLAGPPSASYRLRKLARKYRKVLATAGAFATLLVVATVSSLALASWALRERTHADQQKQSAEVNFKRALEAVDKMLTRVGEVQLAQVPQMEPVRRDLFQDALRFYQEFLRERGDSPAVRAEAAYAYRRVAYIQVVLGQADEGEAAYRQAIALLEQLAAESPGDPAVRDTLPDCHSDLAWVYYSTRRWPQADASFQQAVALREQLERDHPAPQNRGKLAGIHANLVALYRQVGDLDKAEAAFLRSRTLLDNLLAGDPKDVKTRAILATAYNNVGLVYTARQRTGEAEAAYQKALELYQQLARDEPEELDHQSQLAGAQNNLGLLYTRLRQLDKAAVAYQQSLALKKAILDDHPKVVEFRVDLAASYGNMAGHVRRTGSVEESLDWSARTIDTVEPVLKKDARHVRARTVLFDALMGRGYALVRVNRREDAVKDWRRMIEISDGHPHIQMRLYRPYALVFLGEHAQATAEVEALVSAGQGQDRNLIMFAQVYSLGAAAAAQDARLLLPMRVRLADQYGGRAIELLKTARAAGYFGNPARLVDLKEGNNLDAVRSRPDFQSLLADVEKK